MPLRSASRFSGTPAIVASTAPASSAARPSLPVGDQRDVAQVVALGHLQGLKGGQRPRALHADALAAHLQHVGDVRPRDQHMLQLDGVELQDLRLAALAGVGADRGQVGREFDLAAEQGRA